MTATRKAKTPAQVKKFRALQKKAFQNWMGGPVTKLVAKRGPKRGDQRRGNLKKPIETKRSRKAPRQK